MNEPADSKQKLLLKNSFGFSSLSHRAGALQSLCIIIIIIMVMMMMMMMMMMMTLSDQSFSLACEENTVAALRGFGAEY